MSTQRPGTDIGYLLNKAARRFRLKLAGALADTGLTSQQAAVLLAIGRSDDARLTPRAIAETIDTDPATTSGLLDRLTRDGWLVSEPNPADGRSRLLALSARADEALVGVLAAAEAASREATACLSQAEIDTLVGLLARLCGPEAGSPADKQAGVR